MTDKITFEKATHAHQEIIFSWLAQPHVREFWDDTQGHKDDILNFMGGRKEPSNYCDGKYVYWVAFLDDQPYGMLMTIHETHEDCGLGGYDPLKNVHLSPTGTTYSLDFMIGCKDFLGQGLGPKTLVSFMDYFRHMVDKKANTFIICPATNNPRARHVYEKAGFTHVADFLLTGNCSGSGKPHHLLIKKFAPTVVLQPASMSDYPMIQNMARFYVYDLSRECGHISDDWRLPADGLFESFDFKNYFDESERKAYLVKVYDDVAGFVLLHQNTACQGSDSPVGQGSRDVGWNVGEFFILARYQGHGVGAIAAEKMWQLHPGKWEVCVIPENISALNFWESTIRKFTNHVYEKEIKQIDFDKDQPKRVIFSFVHENKPAGVSKNNKFTVVKAGSADIDAMNHLSYLKRRSYEKAQPRFWKWAGDPGEESQKSWFKELIQDKDHICLVAKNAHETLGFVIGKRVPAPEVYAPGGPTLMIDDFCVINDEWQTIGEALIKELKAWGGNQGISQYLVVCGYHDQKKRDFLTRMGMTPASLWFVGDER